ncbi:hypothetical protein NM96_07250 [Neisseria mucosa]|nr:hypothetical protein NM96_07250 [Neisseria mucosa]
MFDCKCLCCGRAGTLISIGVEKGRLKMFGTICHVCFQTTSFNFIRTIWQYRAYRQLRRHFVRDGAGRGR